MPSNIIIRKAIPGDAAILYQFTCFFEEKTLDEKFFDLNFPVFIDDPTKTYLVATQNEEMVGFISAHGQLVLHEGGIVYEIQELFVSRPNRGKRVGSLLVRSLKEELKQQACTTVKVNVPIKNSRAKKFFEMQGMKADQICYKTSL